MRNFMKVCDGINVAPMNFMLKQRPQLWNQRTLRKEMQDSPHLAMSDIWIRYNDDRPYIDSGDYTGFHDVHYPIWYPAADEIPGLKALALGLMAKMGATHLGGVLITKIPSGGRVEPHIDSNWHADFYNCKLYVPLQANPECFNRCEDEFVVMKAGECWYFNNHVEHEVQNNGNDDRITLIICMRIE
jgi:hypothetical protein